VIQEALTNVLRHAGAASATVRLDYRPEELRVEVTDLGGAADPPPAEAGAPPGGGGLGIVGMRERVTALGGTFAAGPGVAGGFRVYACLPSPGGPS
jgi:signal transduction histidine kinase